MSISKTADQKAELLEQLDRANKRWDYAYGKWLETRLSTWDEEVSLASKQIGFISRQLDKLSEPEAICERGGYATAAE